MSGDEPTEPQPDGVQQAEDPLGPTSAAPEPVAPEPGVAAAFQPASAVGPETATFDHAGSALLGAGEAVDPHPEKLVGAAFAGGFVAALLLKGMARRRHAR